MNETTFLIWVGDVPRVVNEAEVRAALDEYFANVANLRDGADFSIRKADFMAHDSEKIQRARLNLG